MKRVLTLCAIFVASNLAVAAARAAAPDTSLSFRSHTIGAGVSAGNLEGDSCPAGTLMLSGSCHPGFDDRLIIINQFPNRAQNTWRCGFKNNSNVMRTVWVYTLCGKPQTAPSTARVINMIPSALSGESHQDSEPFLAVDRANPRNMVGTAFTLNPNPAQTGRAPLFVTSDQGDTWLLSNIVPSNQSTSDITVAGTKKGTRLHAGILKRPGSLLENILRTDNFFSTTVMSEQESRSQVDQPFVQARRFSGTDRVYVGNNDFAAGTRSATIDVSLDDGATYTPIRIEFRNTSGQDGPSIRPAVAEDGTVYAAFFGWRSFNGSIATSDVVVVRDDNGATGASPFQDLTDPSDGLPGLRIVTGITIPWSNAPTVGNERIGSTLSLAVHPRDSRKLCVAWADNAGGTVTYMAHIRCSNDRGATWGSDLRRLANATPFAIAIADNGTVGFLYQQFANNRWVTHLEQSRDAFATIQDTVLANVPGNTPAPQFLPYLGDYNYMLSIGSEFRGIFSTNNTPDMANFPQGVVYQRKADFAAKTLLDNSGNQVAISIDPFYFTAKVLE